MDKMIEHPEFTGIVSLIRHATFVAREEFGHSNLRTDLDSGSHDPNVSFPRSSHTLSVNDALLEFATMDHASLLGLGNLDMQGMQQLCAFEGAKEVSEGMLIDSGGGEGNSGGVGDNVGDSSGDGDVSACKGGGDGGGCGGGDDGVKVDGDSVLGVTLVVLPMLFLEVLLYHVLPL